MDFTLAAAERYGFIARTVRRFSYRRLKRAQKAVVLRFLQRVSGYSRQPLPRLVKRGAAHAPLRTRYRGHDWAPVDGQFWAPVRRLGVRRDRD